MLCALMLFAPSSATAQVPLADVERGAEAGVWARGLKLEEYFGRYLGLANDTLVFEREGGALLRVPLDSLWRMRVYRRKPATRRSMQWALGKGAAIGAAIAAGGTILWQRSNADCGECRFGPTPDEEKRWQREDRLVLAGTTAAGAMVSGWYFARRHRKHGIQFWERVLPPSRGASLERPARDDSRWAIVAPGVLAWRF